MDDDLDLLLPLLFVVADDRVGIKVVSDLCEEDLLLELLCIRLLSFLLEDVLLFFLEGEEDSFNIS